MASGQRATIGFFAKRELLYEERPDVARVRAAGQGLLADGLLDAALEFFLKAGDTGGLEQVLETARAAGDAFTFEAALRALGRTAAPEEWVRLGETAFAAGLLSFAYRAFEKADNQAGLEQVRREQSAAGSAPPA